LYKGESVPFKKVTEKIKCKSGNSVKEIDRDILFTVHGPVVQDEGDKVISMRWTGHEPSTEFKYMYLVDRASNVDDFRNALSYYQLGAQNFIYADTDGTYSTGRPERIVGATLPAHGFFGPRKVAGIYSLR
jgi:penicillin amidase